MGPLGAKGAAVAASGAKAAGCLAKLGPFGHLLGGLLHFVERLEGCLLWTLVILFFLVCALGTTVVVLLVNR